MPPSVTLYSYSDSAHVILFIYSKRYPKKVFDHFVGLALKGLTKFVHIKLIHIVKVLVCEIMKQIRL